MRASAVGSIDDSWTHSFCDSITMNDFTMSANSPSRRDALKSSLSFAGATVVLNRSDRATGFVQPNDHPRVGAIGGDRTSPEIPRAESSGSLDWDLWQGPVPLVDFRHFAGIATRLNRRIKWDPKVGTTPWLSRSHGIRRHWSPYGRKSNSLSVNPGVELGSPQ